MTTRTKLQRRDAFDAMRARTLPSAGATTIYGIRISEMSKAELRIALEWAVSRTAALETMVNKS
jgi:hypothetical protein